MLLIALLKADKLVKLTEAGRLFIPCINDSVGEEIHSDSAVTTRFIQFVCMSSRACKL